MKTLQPTFKPHSLRTTLLLHLAPGALLSIVFLAGAPFVMRAGGSSYLALVLSIPCSLVPFVLGVFFFEKKRTGRNFLFLITPLRNPRVSMLETLVGIIILWITAQAFYYFLAPISRTILSAFTDLMPSWAINLDNLDPSDISTQTLFLGLFLSGFVGSIIQELYFRGYLLPRMSVPGIWGSVLHAALFSIFHFYCFWRAIEFFVIFLPLVLYVKRKGNLLTVIIIHIMFNSLGIIIALISRL
jgi:membrane protease YdiL (CAAX protease family)